MALQKHTNASNTPGDKLPTGDHLNKPFIVNPFELIDAFDTPKHKVDPDKDEKYIRVNAYDVNEGKAYVNALLFNPALVDQLGQYVNANGDDATVVRFVDKATKDGNNTYRTVEEASDEEYDKAAEVDYEAAFAARRAELNANTAPASGGEKPKQSAQKAKIDEAFSR